MHAKQRSKRRSLHRGRRKTDQKQTKKKDPRTRKGLGANPGHRKSQNSQVGSAELRQIRLALNGGMDWWRMEWPIPESETYFSEAQVSRKMPEIPQKERFLPNFRLRNSDRRLNCLTVAQIVRVASGQNQFFADFSLEPPDCSAR